MDDRKHKIQDSLEKYAVWLMQRVAEDEGVAIRTISGKHLVEFENYLADKKLTMSDLTSGADAVYKENCDRHLPAYVRKLAEQNSGIKFEFHDVEKEMRDKNQKADFKILMSDSRSKWVSLKNYDAPSVGRLQVSSGTFNSFINNFLFEQAGVGQYQWPSDPSRRFRGATKAKRNEAYSEIGLASLVPDLEKLDALNEQIRERFINSPEFEFLDEGIFDKARKECGHAGAELAFEILGKIETEIPGAIQKRILKMSGLDGAEELLSLSKSEVLDSITNKEFGRRLHLLKQPDAVFERYHSGQNINFEFKHGSESLFTINVPFTINKNGAWISGDHFEGTRWHAKEKRDLAHGQRRPRKSRELATSINTYVNLSGVASSLNT